jgi:hypothetical protein
MAIQRRGNLGSQRNPDIDPAVTYQLERLRRGIPAITYGDSFPSVADLGDMHYYTGEDSVEAKKNNWYNATNLGEWKPMSGVITDGSQIRGAIPSGVTVADYLSLLGGIMTGDIVFASTQLIPASQITGTMAADVVLNNYLKTTGGQLTGNLDMTNKQITRVQKITGLSNTSIDMSVDGVIALLATTINITGIINFTGPIGITGDLAISGDLQVNGTDIGISTDTDLLKLALNLLTVNGALTTSGNLQVNGTNIGISTDTDLLVLALNLLTVNGQTLLTDKLLFTQTDGNEYIDSLDDGFLDYGATTAHRFLANVKLTADDRKIIFGAADDMAMSYNGTSGRIETDLQNPSDLVVACGANKTIVLEDVVYKDINIGGALLVGNPTVTPGEVQFKDNTGTDTGVYTYAFKVNEGVHGGFELQHDYKEGTDVVFHVHWQGIAAPTGTDNVQWRLTYLIMRDDVVQAASVTIDSPDTAFDTQYENKRTDFVAIDGTNFKIGDQFMFSLFRVAADGDAYAGDALIQTAGIHYEVDTLGSRQIGTK